MLWPYFCTLSPLRKIPDIYCIVSSLEFTRGDKEEKLFFELYGM
jgi:hypothetical protein